MPRPTSLTQLARVILDVPCLATILVAIDGPGGAGKSTFAARLSTALGDAPIVHTDDFASADNPIDWWPRTLHEVIEPLASGRVATYQRYDWPTESLADWITVEPGGVVIIEGVSASRREWSSCLSYSIFIETPAEVRLQRGLLRDGDERLDDWQEWMAAEDAHFARDLAVDRADMVLDGTSQFPDGTSQFPD